MDNRSSLIFNDSKIVEEFQLNSNSNLDLSPSILYFKAVLCVHTHIMKVFFSSKFKISNMSNVRWSLNNNVPHFLSQLNEQKKKERSIFSEDDTVPICNEKYCFYKFSFANEIIIWTNIRWHVAFNNFLLFFSLLNSDLQPISIQR